MAELREVQRLLDAFPVEVAESRASPKQLAFQRAFFARADETGRRCKVFVAMGGNRSGKSICAGWLCFAKYLRDVARHGDTFWCVGQTLDRSIGGQQKELWNALPRWMFGKQRWEEKGGFASGRHAKVTLPTQDGGRCLVEFRSADQAPSTFEQAKLRGVWLDERVSEEIFDRVIPRTLDLDGFILYSDIPEQWWQFERLKEADPGAGVYFAHFCMRDNEKNLAEGAVEQAKALMSEDQQKLRIDGDFRVMEGVVYREYIDQKREEGGHLVAPFPGGIPEDWPKWRMIDYGGSAPTACLWSALAPNEHLYHYREYYQKYGSIYEHAKAIHAASGATVREVKMPPDDRHRTQWIKFEVEGGERYRCTYIDPAAFARSPANELNIAEQYADFGIKCRPWPKTNEMGEHAMVQRVKYRYEHFTVWVYDCLHNFRREKRSWKYKADSEGVVLDADAFENRNNHLLDCEKGFIGTNPSFSGPVVRIASGE